jgi:hypothetical protein
MNLKNCKIVGYFSTPSPSMAEHNPIAYQIAMSEVPAGAGVCAHCGTWIIHHIVVLDETGVKRFIGTTCADKIGLDREAVRAKLTTEQLAERKAKLAERMEDERAKRQAHNEAVEARLTARREKVGDLVDMLRRFEDGFRQSLADQLESWPLSQRQAHFVARASLGVKRRTDKNAEQWDAIVDRCTT